MGHPVASESIAVRRLTPLLLVLCFVLAACGAARRPDPEAVRNPPTHGPAAPQHVTADQTSTTPVRNLVYSHVTTSELRPEVAAFPARVYVPNNLANTVDVIDPATFKVIDHFKTGKVPHHIAPSWDMKSLYIDNTYGNTLTPIDPMTGKPGQPIPVEDPYNLYFTPDGTKAIVVAERFQRLDFRDPRTWALVKSVHIPWAGADHLDFSADGKYLMVTTEFTGMLARVDTEKMELSGAVHLGGLPVDVKLSPDGSVFYVTNQDPQHSGVSVVDPAKMAEIQFIPTESGAHGLYVSRDAKRLYVSNRLAGSISVIDFATRAVVDTWHTGGSPDMIQISPDGKQLWVSGRFDSTVYVVDTINGQVLHRIKVGNGDHGLCYFPQPGRFSVGHNGVYR
jgi:YVTN family beta-propeller protein